jgi:hypothetical protein
MGFVSFDEDRSGLVACDDCGRFMIAPDRLSESAWADTDPAELGAQLLLRDDAIRAAIRAGWSWHTQRGEARGWVRWRCPECLAAELHPLAAVK